jgi:hypothetical protein
MMSHSGGLDLDYRGHVNATLRQDALGFYWESEDGGTTTARHRTGDDALDEMLAIWLDRRCGQEIEMTEGQAEVA